MRATRAYIAGAGTTGVLISSSLLLLVVVSALFAFNGGPAIGGQGNGRAFVVGDNDMTFSRSARIAPDAAAAKGAVSKARPSRRAGAPSHKHSGSAKTGGRSGGASDRANPLSAGGGGGGGQATAGGATRSAAGGGGGAGTGGGGGGGALPSVPKAPQAPQLPSVETPVQQLGNTTQQTTQQTTQTLGKAVEPVSPPLGQTVQQTGQALSNVVGGLTDQPDLP